MTAVAAAAAAAHETAHDPAHAHAEDNGLTSKPKLSTCQLLHCAPAGPLPVYIQLRDVLGMSAEISRFAIHECQEDGMPGCARVFSISLQLLRPLARRPSGSPHHRMQVQYKTMNSIVARTSVVKFRPYLLVLSVGLYEARTPSRSTRPGADRRVISCAPTRFAILSLRSANVNRHFFPHPF